MSVCRSCNAEIVWTRTERGKKMPLDAAPVCDAIAETRGLFVASCEFADQHRRPAA